MPGDREGRLSGTMTSTTNALRRTVLIARAAHRPRLGDRRTRSTLARRRGTMVFADISGFTALSERLATRGRIGTEELVETLSRVFGGMLDDLGPSRWTAPEVRWGCAPAAVHRPRSRSPGGLGCRRDSSRSPVGEPDPHFGRQAEAHDFDRRSLRRVPPLPGGRSVPSTRGRWARHHGGDELRDGRRSRPDRCQPGDGSAARDREYETSDDGELVVRWRRGWSTRSRCRQSRATDAEAARRVTPPIIASLLEHGAPDPVHRIATMAFFKFKGTDNGSRPTAPTDWQPTCTRR